MLGNNLKKGTDREMMAKAVVGEEKRNLTDSGRKMGKTK